MPAPTRPSTYPDWALTGTRSNPGGSAINTGYTPDFIPPASWHNWQFGFLGDWVRWLDYVTQLNLAQFEFDAVVGTNGSYPDINSLMTAIIGGATGLNKILVTTAQTLAATQVIPSTITDMEFVFKPSTVYSKGLTTTPGLSIAGQRITIRGGRWTSFNGGSDVAIQFEAASKNCRAVDINFAGNTTAINDLGANNNLANNIEEV